MKELISVIIPIYNGEKYIQNIANALIAQTYKNLEIIMVDDGSKDNSYELCNELTKEDVRFIVYSKENGGASSARNFGLERAKGEYIGFIDVDDYIFPEYFEYLYSMLTKYQADMACCSYYKMWDSEKMPVFENDGKEIVFTQKEDTLKDLLYRKNITGSPCLKLYKCEILKNIKFPSNIIYGEDTIFTFQVLKVCRKVIFGNKVLYIYYQHSTSSTHVVNCSRCEDSWNIHINKILNYAEEKNPQILKAAYAKCFILAIDYCCRIWKDPKSKEFKKKLLEYIKYADEIVLRDKECKAFNRLLALLGCINVHMMIQLCRLYSLRKKTFKFETRKSV